MSHQKQLGKTHSQKEPKMEQPETAQKSKSFLETISSMFGGSKSSLAGVASAPTTAAASATTVKVKKKKVTGKEYFAQQQALRKQPPAQGVKLVVFEEETKKMFAAAIEKKSSVEKKTSENKKDNDKPALGAIVVTIYDGSSYDNLFRMVPQQGDDGEMVKVYECRPEYVQTIIEVLKTGDIQTNKDNCSVETLECIKQLKDDIEELNDNDSVVFNYECCSGCCDSHFCLNNEFGNGETIGIGKQKLSNQKTLEHIRFFIDQGYMVMCSDFSLKALIKNWDDEILGANPFVKTGGRFGSVKIRFNPLTLQDCPSAQLAKVGELLSDKDYCYVECMSDTIVYSVKDQHNASCDEYILQVLTLAETNQGSESGNSTEITAASATTAATTTVTSSVTTFASEPGICSVTLKSGEVVRGSAGHVMLTYKSGGRLLTSMTHWSELVKLDISEDQLFKEAERAYGKTYRANMESEFAMLALNEQESWVSEKASRMVQCSAPSMTKNAKMKQAKRGLW